MHFYQFNGLVRIAFKFFNLKNSIFCVVALLFIFQMKHAVAQESINVISGKVTNASGISLRHVTIKLGNSTISTRTDSNGNYQLVNIKEGNYAMVVTAVGFAPSTRTISIGKNAKLIENFAMDTLVNELQSIQVYGRTKVEEANKQPFNVTAIDATKLYNTTLTISNVLDRVSGVRVRESGGVGSDFNISINGFSGKSIRYFIDGIPMDNFGSAFQLNNIPINLAERIEVYKGVVPIWLGGDALGGAVNIISGDRARNYIDASYSIGSFNTHRTVINGAFTTNKGFTVQLNAFQNYSDNNYKVKVEASDINTGEFAPAAYLPRFHDTYHNETIIANVGVVDKKFADKLLFGITLGQRYKELQTGSTMGSVFGQIHSRGNILMPSLKYQKSNLIDGLDLTVNANFNFGEEQYMDTVDVRYDWYGNVKSSGSNGERAKSHYIYRNNNGLLNVGANYKIDEKQSIAFNNAFNSFNRKGSDALDQMDSKYDNPRKTNKNILALGYNYALQDKWAANLFVKYITQTIVAGDDGIRRQDISNLGYGLAFTYFVNSNFQLKSSYEQTNRVPEAIEIFGDVQNLDGNTNIKSERSHNANVGIIKNFSLNDENKVMITGNAIYRYATDFIYFRQGPNPSRLIADNLDGVRTWAGDMELRYSFKNWLSAGTTLTYQYLQNLQKYDKDANGNPMEMESPIYLDQMPNIPYLFGNADISVSVPKVGGERNNLSIAYNLLYVNKFWFRWPTLGGTDANAEKRFVPTQLSHDLSAVYTIADGKYNVGLEVRNLANDLLYDNFSLQKPARGYYLNLRYFLFK